MPGNGPRGGIHDRPRRWAFAGCILDEASWCLTVNGRRVALETKPLELLRELLAHAGNVVSKDALLDAIWPDVTVVEASLSTAVYKLRLALRDDGRARRIIETVSGVGYRLVVPVEVEEVSASSSPSPPLLVASARRDQGDTNEARRRTGRRLLKFGSIFSALAAGSMLVAFPFFQPQNMAASTTRSFTQRDVENALRRLDIPTVERMLAQGLDPNRSFDREGNGPINYVLNMCEWDPGHDQRKLLLMVRTLFEAGARLDRRNVWGDTPYSIASAPRYCGPRHPVTVMLRALCYAGANVPGDRCLASYQLTRRRGQRG